MFSFTPSQPCRATPCYVAIIGSTGSGKSAMAMDLATALDGEIVNCDSVQLYKHFDVGSAKPSPADQAKIPHHLIDLLDVHDVWDANRFADQARKTIVEIASRGKLPILVGGSGLYLRATWGDQFHELPSDTILREALNHISTEELREELQQGDPQRANDIHRHDRFRLCRAVEILRLTGKSRAETIAETPREQEFFHPKAIILMKPKNLQQRIILRTRKMLEDGLIAEVQNLRDVWGCSFKTKPMLTIGYKQVCDFLLGSIEERELEEKIVIATRQYAKKQNSWFRRLTPHLTVESPTDVDFEGFKAKFLLKT